MKGILYVHMYDSGHRAQKGQRGYEAFVMEEHNIPESYRRGQDLSDEERREFWISDGIQAIALRTPRRRFIITKQGLFGLGPPDTEIGDSVYVILDLRVPAILRNKDDMWHFVGESFITGIMDGEIVEQREFNSPERPKQPQDSSPKLEQILLC